MLPSGRAGDAKDFFERSLAGPDLQQAILVQRVKACFTRDLLETLLLQWSADVHAVRSVGAALDELAGWKPHLLISDLGMPEQDGFALIRQVRAGESSSGGHLPAIALSAFASHEDRAQALMAGFDAHVAKPASPDDLVRRIAHLLKWAA